MRRVDLVLPLAYALIGLIWISASDAVVLWIYPNDVATLSTWKGFAFILVTAALLWVVLRAQQRRTDDVAASLRDTARRLEQARRDYQVIIENMPDLFFRTTGEGRFQIVSRVGGEMLGYTNAEFMDMNIRDLCFGPEDRSRLTAALSGGEGKRVAVDLRLRRKDGQPMWASLNVIPRYVAGKAMAVDAIARNMTAAFEATADLKMAKQAAEAASVSKSRFLAAASHDLRQPVQSLFLFAGVLDQQLQGRRARKMVGDMTRALDGLKILLDGLLDMSRLDAGLVVPQFENVPLAPLLGRLAEEYGQRAAMGGLRLRFAPTGAVVRSDVILLERMLRSLLDNALRFTPFGAILLGCRRRGDRLVLQVIDTGIGIPREQHADIFEEFHQLGNAERDRTKGLGLGLAIVRRLGRLLGHRIEVSSALGRGACFSIETPLIANRAEIPATVPVPEHVATTTGGIVVVIEDEPLVRLGFQTMLEGWGYEVLAAATCEEALEEIDRAGRSPDLIIADYRLPNNAVGTEAIHTIHQHCGSSAPGLIVTGDTAPQRLREAKASGFDLLHKPVSAAELQKVVRTLMAA